MRIGCMFASMLLLLSSGCGNADVESNTSSNLDPFGIDLPMPEPGLVYTASETKTERNIKADRLLFRGEYEDIFGITNPPAGPVRGIAEFETSDGILVAYDDFVSDFILDLIATLAPAGQVYVVTPDIRTSNGLRALLQQRGVEVDKLTFFEFPHESFWTRDFGPIPVVDDNGTSQFVDAQYYAERRRDDAMTTLIANYLGTPVTRPPLATEGGNFMTDGQGLCMVTEWLLDENPNLSGAQLQSIQKNYFGCERTLVLERLAGEGTGHIDMFAKFVSPTTVLVGEYDPRFDPTNAAILDRNVERILALNDQGANLRVLRIPMPPGVGDVYRSYTNSTIFNDRVIVPVYPADTRYEAAALEVYRNAMPAGYEIVTVKADQAIQYGGAVHCTTSGFALGQRDPMIAPAQPAPSMVETPPVTRPSTLDSNGDAPSTSGASPGLDPTPFASFPGTVIPDLGQVEDKMGQVEAHTGQVEDQTG